MKHTLRTAVAATAIALLVAACGDGEQAAPTTTQTSATSAASTTTIEVPTSTTEKVTAFPARRGALTAGTTYNVGRVVLHRPLQLTASVDGQRGEAKSGALWIFDDEHVYVTLTDIAQLRVFTDPLFDASVASGSADAMMQATEPMPQDPLAWAASIPGIEVGPLTETTFGGQPARSMTYRLTDISGAPLCPGSTTVKCVTGNYLPADDTTVSWRTTDSGTFYELQIEGATYFIDVADVAGAAALAESISVGD